VTPLGCARPWLHLPGSHHSREVCTPSRGEEKQRGRHHLLAFVLLVVLAWVALVLMKGSKEVVESDTDLQAGHQFPAERGDAPSLLEDDLSFADDESDAARRTDRDAAPR
jgi:hypothetical protein